VLCSAVPHVPQANKPPFHDAYAGPPDLQPSEGLLPTPDTPPGRGGVPGDPGMPASPFAAVAADLEAPSPRPSADYGRAEPRSGHRRQGSDASGNSFFQLLLGMAAGKTTPLQGGWVGASASHQAGQDPQKSFLAT
jgi:hypothetical protein